jgi:hypothetical protein
MDDTKDLNIDRLEVQGKLDELAGRPETLQKQVRHQILSAT